MQSQEEGGQSSILERLLWEGAQICLARLKGEDQVALLARGGWVRGYNCSPQMLLVLFLNTRNRILLRSKQGMCSGF